MLASFIDYWRWVLVPLNGGDGSALIKALRKSQDAELALILVCIAHIRNKIYRDTGYDLLIGARSIQENQEAFMPAGKKLWLENGSSYAPQRRAFTIWMLTLVAKKPAQLENLCLVWKELQRGAPLIHQAAEIASSKLNESINIDSYNRIPTGVC